MSKVIFQLQDKLVYQSAQGVSGCEAFDLELIEPTYEQRAYSRKLKQIVHQALIDTSNRDDIHHAKMVSAMGFDASKFAESIEQVNHQEKEPQTYLEKKKEAESDVSWMRNILLSIPNYGFSDAVEEFSDNAQFLVKVDEGVFLKDALVRQLGEQIMDDLFCYYCLNFIVPYLAQTLNGTKS